MLPIGIAPSGNSSPRALARLFAIPICWPVRVNRRVRQTCGFTPDARILRLLSITLLIAKETRILPAYRVPKTSWRTAGLPSTYTQQRGNE
jgi:hypothetical protein